MMRFTAERDALLTAVKRASSVVMARNNIPVLGCLHIAAADNTVAVRGTNLDEWVVVKLAAAVTVPGEICVDAALLSAWLGVTPKGALVDFTLTDHRAVLVAGRATASFATFPREDFPVQTDDDTRVEVTGAIDALRTCAPYCSDEEVMFYLKGVAINGGHAVATNRQILCAVDISAPVEVNAIVPTFGVRQVSRASGGARLFIGQYTWTCEDGAIFMGGKLIDGTFPDWRRALPKDSKTVCTVDADALASAVTQVQVASGDRAKVIVMEGDGADIAISCRGDVMTAGSQVSYEGEAFRTGLNSKYAQIAAATFAGRVVVLAQEDAVSPIVITCEDAPGLRACVFPMRV